MFVGNKYFSGILFCLFAVLSWGGMFPIMGDALRFMNPFAFTAIRYTCACALFLVLLRRREGAGAFALEGRALLVWLLGSLGFAGFGFLVFLGQKMAGSSGALNASIMMALMPLLSVVINWVFRGIKPMKYSICFVLMSLVGVLCVVTKGDFAAVLRLQESLFADLLILLGALGWVTYTIGASFFPRWSALRYTALTTALGVPTIWFVNVALNLLGLNPVPTTATILSIGPAIVYMVVVAGFLGVLSWNAGNRILNPVNGVLFMDAVPITTFMIAALRGYAFNRAELVGAALTTSALALNNVYQRLAATRLAAVPHCTRKAGSARARG